MVIPVEKKKDGSFSARSGILSREELHVVSAYVDTKIRQIGREILDGKIAANPYEKGNEEACTYCAYKKVCGFDGSIPGYEKRQLEDLDKQTLLVDGSTLRQSCLDAEKIAERIIPQLEEITVTKFSKNPEEGIRELFLLLAISYKMRGEVQ